MRELLITIAVCLGRRVRGVGRKRVGQVGTGPLQRRKEKGRDEERERTRPGPMAYTTAMVTLMALSAWHMYPNSRNRLTYNCQDLM